MVIADSLQVLGPPRYVTRKKTGSFWGD